MMDRPARSNSLARAKMVSAPSPLITDMRAARGRISGLACRNILWGWGHWDTQRIYKARKEFKHRSGGDKLHDLWMAVCGFQFCVELVVNLAGRMMQPVGTSQTQLLRLGERAAFEIRLDRGDVRFRRPLLPGRQRVRRHRVERALQH